MEWTRIEAKWHDMARRLQRGCPSTHVTPDAVNVPVSRTDSQTAQDPVVPIADDVAVRPEV